MNPIYLTDFYKQGHINQYPEGTTRIYSNLTPRSDKHAVTQGINSGGVVVFGIKEMILNLTNTWNREFFRCNLRSMMQEYKAFIHSTLGIEDVDTKHFEDLHAFGCLPIEIRCLPEGTFCPIGVPVMTIINSVSSTFWLTNFLESYISNETWKYMTNATIAREYRTIFEDYSDKTGGSKEFIDFQGHDFSFRGMSGSNDGTVSGMAHLTQFTGTDTVPAVKRVMETYTNPPKMLIGTSVPATEHSVMCMGSQEGEYETFKRLIMETYPKGPISIVSDTWDFWKVIGEFLPKLKDDIMGRDGKVIIRPDSGDPVDIICGTDEGTYQTVEEALAMVGHNHYEVAEEACEGSFNYGATSYTTLIRVGDDAYNVTSVMSYDRHDKQYYYVESVLGVEAVKVELSLEQIGLIECLWEIFGGTINDKGYKTLDPHIGAIYGDSITLARAESILSKLEAKGFASDNIVFGIGSYTYQYSTRDTFGFAVKSTAGEIRNETIQIFKDPKTDDGTKKSLKGYLSVRRDDNGELYVVDGLSEECPHTLLQAAYTTNRGLVMDEPFSKIRDRAISSIKQGKK